MSLLCREARLFLVPAPRVRVLVLPRPLDPHLGLGLLGRESGGQAERCGLRGRGRAAGLAYRGRVGSTRGQPNADVCLVRLHGEAWGDARRCDAMRCEAPRASVSSIAWQSTRPTASSRLLSPLPTEPLVRVCLPACPPAGPTKALPI